MPHSTSGRGGAGEGRRRGGTQSPPLRPHLERGAPRFLLAATKTNRKMGERERGLDGRFQGDYLLLSLARGGGGGGGRREMTCSVMTDGGSR